MKSSRCQLTRLRWPNLGLRDVILLALRKQNWDSCCDLQRQDGNKEIFVQSMQGFLLWQVSFNHPVAELRMVCWEA
jgi:hypothetical protein